MGNLYEIRNLSETEFPESPFPVKGFIYDNGRFVIPLVCRLVKNPAATINVWFVVNTASPFTFLSEWTIRALQRTHEVPISRFNVSIQVRLILNLLEIANF
jgi:hypothetical protein